MDTSTSRRSFGLATGVVLALSAVACTTVQGSQGQSGATTSTPSVTSTPSTTASGEDSEGGDDTAAGSTTTEDSARHTTGRTTTARKNPTTTTATKASTSGPKVDSLTVVRKPLCRIVGTPDAPFSQGGVDVIIGWKVSGAPGAAIAVDNPGVYGGYGSDHAASGQLELSFPCDSGSGTTSHTYTVWPQGAKGVSKTITVTATNSG